MVAIVVLIFKMKINVMLLLSTVIRAVLTRAVDIEDVRFPNSSQANLPVSVLIPAGFIRERSSFTSDKQQYKTLSVYCGPLQILILCRL